MTSRRQKPSVQRPRQPKGAPPKKTSHPKPARPQPRPAAKQKPKPKVPVKGAPKASPPPAAKTNSAAKVVETPLEVPLPGGRHHVLSLSFVRDGDEFLARLETDGGHITELKNRSLDQLLTLVASELEDLLE
ncbi:MAG TPA: hypothetical protein VEH57_03550 [Thermoplasmata archaeon]|nr:hypothetical protein [Thermoplasmata archaeon]